MGLLQAFFGCGRWTFDVVYSLWRWGGGHGFCSEMEIFFLTFVVFLSSRSFTPSNPRVSSSLFGVDGRKFGQSVGMVKTPQYNDCNARKQVGNGLSGYVQNELSGVSCKRTVAHSPVGMYSPSLFLWNSNRMLETHPCPPPRQRIKLRKPLARPGRPNGGHPLRWSFAVVDSCCFWVFSDSKSKRLECGALWWNSICWPGKHYNTYNKLSRCNFDWFCIIRTESNYTYNTGYTLYNTQYTVYIYFIMLLLCQL